MKGANIVDKNSRAEAYVGSFLVVRNPLFSFFLFANCDGMN